MPLRSLITTLYALLRHDTREKLESEFGRCKRYPYTYPLSPTHALCRKFSGSLCLWHSLLLSGTPILSHYSPVVANLQQLICISIIMLIRIACLAVPCCSRLQLAEARELSACPGYNLGHGVPQSAAATAHLRRPGLTRPDQADSVAALSQTHASLTQPFWDLLGSGQIRASSWALLGPRKSATAELPLALI